MDHHHHVPVVTDHQGQVEGLSGPVRAGGMPPAIALFQLSGAGGELAADETFGMGGGFFEAGVKLGVATE
jgi:hypothetical protein